MRARLALIALLASPFGANAFPVMQVQDCAAAWKMIMKGEHASHHVTDDGWCSASNPAFFNQIEWRAEGLEQLLQHGLPPTALAIRVADADMIRSLGEKTPAGAPAMPIQIRLSLRQNTEQKQLVVEALEIIGPKDNEVTLQGTFHDVDLSSAAKMQISLGSAKLRDVTIVGIGNRKLEPYLRLYIGNTFPERSRKRTAMIDDMMDWPNHSFPAATKQAVKQLIASLPAPNGTLRVKVDTGAGLSAAPFVHTFVFGGSQEELSERILGSTVFHATWTKAE